VSDETRAGADPRMGHHAGKPYGVTATATTGRFRGRVALISGHDTLEAAEWAAERLRTLFGIGTAEAGPQ